MNKEFAYARQINNIAEVYYFSGLELYYEKNDRTSDTLIETDGQGILLKYYYKTYNSKKDKNKFIKLLIHLGFEKLKRLC